MRLLLDTCLSANAATVLRAAGHDVEHAGLWPEDPGDQEILARARSEGRVPVTLDRDFGELAIVRGEPHCGIVRLVGVAAGQQGALCLQALQAATEEFPRGAIVTATTTRLRVRAPATTDPAAEPPVAAIDDPPLSA